jgi:N-carbamoyl-L-amino-acid hydrolase
MSEPKIDPERLMQRMEEMAKIGGLPGGGVERLTLSEEDRHARDLLKSWMENLELQITIDEVGNMFGIFNPNNSSDSPIFLGSHLDTVGKGGKYDGSLGVLAGLEVIETIKESGISVSNPIGLVNFTNEEGVRFTPDMMGSLVLKSGITVEEILRIRSLDGKSVFGDELKKIGYDGPGKVNDFTASTYLELHIEQGPVLEIENVNIGAVEMVQGISWNEVTLHGEANHAGTTPMYLRKDAGFVAASIIQYARQLTKEIAGQVANAGLIEVEPNLINVVPAKVRFTLDMRNQDNVNLKLAEESLKAYAQKIAADENVKLEIKSLVRFDPVHFDKTLINLVENSAKDLGYSVKRIPSGAGHDAQMMAALCPTAMIFIPSKNGVSHSIHEYSSPEDIERGANVLLRAAFKLAR